MNRDVMMARFARDLSLPRALFSTSLISIVVFENHIKSRIQHCERSELHLHFELTKIHQKLAKLTIFGIFNEFLSTPNVTVARFARNVECDFFCDFQTLCSGRGPIRKASLVAST